MRTQYTDMGITTDVFPKLDDGSTTPSAEVDNAELDEMNRYISLLAVSARRDLENPEALRGEAVFEALNCSDCHTPTMTTGEYHPMAELRKQTIHAYTDMSVVVKPIYMMVELEHLKKRSYGMEVKVKLLKRLFEMHLL